MVDPGYEKEKIQQYVIDNKLEVLGILLTHGHVDHIGAIDCFDVPVYIHEIEYDVLLGNYKEGFELYNKEKPYDIDDIDIVKIDANKVFDVDGRRIEVIFTPGHTRGGVCYKFGDELYTGDTLFKRVVGKWTYVTGSLDELKTSVFNLIENQDEAVNIYPGHGESSTIGDEKLNNLFYKKWLRAIERNK